MLRTDGVAAFPSRTILSSTASFGGSAAGRLGGVFHPKCGNWSTIYLRFRRWSEARVLVWVSVALAEICKANDTLVGYGSRVIDADRTSVCYRSRRADDGDQREKLRVLARERRRFGYRCLHILLCLDGVLINPKKTQQPCCDEGLTVRCRRQAKDVRQR